MIDAHDVNALPVRWLVCRSRLEARAERALMWFVWRLPTRIVYWAFIRVWANATTGQFGTVEAPAVMADDALRCWERREGGDRAFQ